MPTMPGAGGGSNFFLAKGSRAEAAKKRKVAVAASSKSRKGSLVKTKPKTGGKKGKFDTGAGLTKKKRAAEDDDEEILSDASDVVGDEAAGKGAVPDGAYSSDEEGAETAEEKRLRLAKVFLDEIQKEEEDRLQVQGEDEDEASRLDDAINRRLKDDNLQQTGKLKIKVARNYAGANLVVKGKLYRDHKVHKSSVTCHAVTKDGNVVLTGSKDGGLVWWRCLNPDSPADLTRVARVAGGRKGHEEKYDGHCAAVNAVAVTTDGKFYASGDDLNLIHVWKLTDDHEDGGDGSLTKKVKKLHTFRGHRGPVSGLAFRKNSHNLYSCAHDRSVKSWNLDEMAYVETLFGHQDRITGIDAGYRERAVTSGGRDGTVRVWKIVEESQLVFNAPSVASGTSGRSGSGAGSTAAGFVDAVKLIDEESFATCGEDGHLSLWSVLKKKPVSTVKRAHGTDPTNDDPRWVSALATLYNTDLVATGGSMDGQVKLWAADHKGRSLQLVNTIDLGPLMSEEESTSSAQGGFVNSIAFHPGGKHLLVGVGQEHRLGRWWDRMAKAKNGLLVITLNPEPEDKEKGEQMDTS